MARADRRNMRGAAADEAGALCGLWYLHRHKISNLPPAPAYLGGQGLQTTASVIRWQSADPKHWDINEFATAAPFRLH